MFSLDEILDAPLTPTAFVDALQAYAEGSRAAHHPLLTALASGAVTDGAFALRTLLREYYVYSRSFTRHLAAVSANLEDPDHRAALVPNAAEEAGAIDDEHLELLAERGLTKDDVALPHPTLFKRFLESVDLDADELARAPHIATTAWIESFHAICRSDDAQGIGALGIATEGIVRTTYLELLKAIDASFPQLTPRDTSFFVLHTLVDDEHALVLRDIASDLAKSHEARRKMAIGVSKALSARASFFDAMFELIERKSFSAANQEAA